MATESEAEEAAEAGWQAQIDRAIEERFRALTTSKTRTNPAGADADRMQHAGEL